MTARLRRLVERAETQAEELAEGGSMAERVRKAEITGMVGGTMAERIRLARTIHAGPQAEGFSEAVLRATALQDDATARWEAGERPGGL